MSSHQCETCGKKMLDRRHRCQHCGKLVCRYCYSEHHDTPGVQIGARRMDGTRVKPPCQPPDMDPSTVW